MQLKIAVVTWGAPLPLSSPFVSIFCLFSRFFLRQIEPPTPLVQLSLSVVAKETQVEAKEEKDESDEEVAVAAVLMLRVLMPVVSDDCVCVEFVVEPPAKPRALLEADAAAAADVQVQTVQVQMVQVQAVLAEEKRVDEADEDSAAATAAQVQAVQGDEAVEVKEETEADKARSQSK